MKQSVSINLALIIFFIFCGLTPNIGCSQNLKYRGFSYFKPYDDSFTSPESRQKNGVSIAVKGGRFTNQITPYTYPFVLNSQINPSIDSLVQLTTNYHKWQAGLSIGLHYMFLKSRKLTIYQRERNEFNSFNFYFTPYFAIVDTSNYSNYNAIGKTSNNKFFINSLNVIKLTYTTPYLSYRGKLFNFYFMNEFGINISRRNKVVYTNPDDKALKAFLTFDPLRIKLGHGKMYFTSNVNVAFDNTPMQPNKMEANFNAGVQIYMFKEKWTK